MANRSLAYYTDSEPNEDGIHEGWHNTLRIERSAAGQPGLFFIIEDWDGGLKAGESLVVVKDGNALLAPVLEWLRQAPAFTETDLNRMAQRFYEVASASGQVSFNAMTVKPTIVEAIRAALQYVGKA